MLCFYKHSVLHVSLELHKVKFPYAQAPSKEYIKYILPSGFFFFPPETHMSSWVRKAFVEIASVYETLDSSKGCLA